MKANKFIIFDSEKMPLNLIKENDVYLGEDENNRIIKNIKINRVHFMDKFKKYKAEIIIFYTTENSSRIFRDKATFIVNDLNEINIEISGVYREEKISYFETNF